MEVEMEALEETGNVIQDSDYDELESIFPKSTADAQEDSTPVEETEEKEIPEVKKVEEKVEVVEEIKETKEVPASSDENDLRLQLREQRKQMALMQAKLDRLEKRPVVKEKEEIDEDTGEVIQKEPLKEELTAIEVYQNQLNAVAEEKEETLRTILAVMEMNPKYADVEEVCTRQRFDDIFEAAAMDMVEKEGGDLTAAQLAIELNIWKKPNPYVYMYGIIKKYHPDFAEKEVVKPIEEKKPEKKKTPPDTPLSALDIGRAGGKSFGEWTAERIDTMPEHELGKVPKDVYSAYLRGDLDK